MSAITELCGTGNLTSSDPEVSTSLAQQGSTLSTETVVDIKFRDSNNRLVKAQFTIERDAEDVGPVLPWVTGGVPISVTVERTDI